MVSPERQEGAGATRPGRIPHSRRGRREYRTDVSFVMQVRWSPKAYACWMVEFHVLLPRQQRGRSGGSCQDRQRYRSSARRPVNRPSGFRVELRRSRHSWGVRRDPEERMIGRRIRPTHYPFPHSKRSSRRSFSASHRRSSSITLANRTFSSRTKSTTVES